VRCWDDVEVIERAIVLVVVDVSQEFLVVHVPEIRSLNGVVGIEGVRDPVFAIVVSMWCYLHFVSYAMTLASVWTIGLDWRRLSSCIMPGVWGNASLDIGSISCVVGDVAGGIAFAGALVAGLPGALAVALAAGLHFHLVPLHPQAQEGPGCDVVGENISICS
jgi:hypothetical protein